MVFKNMSTVGTENRWGNLHKIYFRMPQMVIISSVYTPQYLTLFFLVFTATVFEKVTKTAILRFFESTTE